MSNLYKLSIYPRGLIFPFHSTISCFNIQGWERSKCTEWLEHLRVKSTLYTLYTCLCGPNFVPFLSMTSRFPDTRLPRIEKKNQKYTEWPQNDLEQVRDKSTLYTISTCPRISNYWPFHSTTSHFQYTRLSKRMHRMTSELSETLNSQKHPVCTKYSTPEAQTQIHFTLSCRKSEVHRMTLQWRWTLDS